MKRVSSSTHARRWRRIEGNEGRGETVFASRLHDRQSLTQTARLLIVQREPNAQGVKR
jgi:hypothetical protein